MARDLRDLEELAPSADLSPLGPGVALGRGRSARPALASPIPAHGAENGHTNARAGSLVGMVTSLVPGLALVAACVAVAFAVNAAIGALSPLVVSVALGALLANLGLVTEAARPGTQFAARHLLRAGVVVLGLQLAIGDMFALGADGLVVVVAVVAVTFFGTQWVGRRLGLSPGLALLVATGFSICGASAVAAMEGVSDARDEDVAYAVALVTLCGSLCILLLPVLQGPLGLDATAFGTWVGASVHDVGQVVATASSAGPVALSAAVVVKLTRVVMLAPMVAGVGLVGRRRARSAAAGAGASDVVGPGASGASGAVGSGGVGPGAVASARRPPLLPLFVVGFLTAVAIRSVGIVPTDWLGTAKTVERVLLSAALVGLGTGVRVARLRRIGGRPLVLGIGAWALVATVSYAGVVLTGA